MLCSTEEDSTIGSSVTLGVHTRINNIMRDKSACHNNTEFLYSTQRKFVTHGHGITCIICIAFVNEAHH